MRPVAWGDSTACRSEACWLRLARRARVTEATGKLLRLAAQRLRVAPVQVVSSMMGAFGSLLLGRMVDRFGFFRIAMAGAMATTVGLALAAGADRLLTLHIAFGLLVGGIGQAAFFSPIAAECSRWFCRHRSFAIAVAASGQSLGGLAVPFLLRAWSDRYGWRSALLVYGVAAGFIIVLCALVFRRTAPGSAVPASRREAAEPLDGPIRLRILLLCTALCLSNFSTFIAIGHLTSYGDERGLTSALSATLISTLLGVTLLTRLSIEALGERWGRSRMLLVMSAMQWFGTLFLVAGHGLESILMGAVLVGLGFGGYLPSYPVLMRDMFPNHQAGRRISEVYFLVFMTAGLGSWVGGYLRDLTGNYTTSFGVAHQRRVRPGRSRLVQPAPSARSWQRRTARRCRALVREHET